MPLANVLATSHSAGSLILRGDPQQLETTTEEPPRGHGLLAPGAHFRRPQDDFEQLWDLLAGDLATK
jgi:hypothetical protein